MSSQEKQMIDKRIYQLETKVKEKGFSLPRVSKENKRLKIYETYIREAASL